MDKYYMKFIIFFKKQDVKSYNSRDLASLHKKICASISQFAEYKKEHNTQPNKTV